MNRPTESDRGMLQRMIASVQSFTIVDTPVTQPPGLVMVTVDSPQFKFQAVGQDRAQAEAVLLAGWKGHLRIAGRERARNMPGPSLEALAEAFDIQEIELVPGAFYRDGEPVALDPRDLTPKATVKHEDPEWQARAHLDINRTVAHHAGHTIGWQAAFRELQEASFKLGEALMNQRPGTCAVIESLNGRGLYWISPVQGQLEVFYIDSDRLNAESEITNVSDWPMASTIELKGQTDSITNWLDRPDKDFLWYDPGCSHGPDKLVAARYATEIANEMAEPATRARQGA